jgi:hypothetical protein
LATAFGVTGVGCDGVGCVLVVFTTGAGFAAGAGAVATAEAVVGAIAGWLEELAAGADADAAIATSGCGCAGAIAGCAAGAGLLATVTGALEATAETEEVLGAGLAELAEDFAARRAAKASDAASTVLGFSSGSGGSADFGTAESRTYPSVPFAVSIFT